MGEKWWSFVLKGDWVWITYFEHKSLHKYIMVARGQDRVEVRKMKNLLLEKNYMLRFVQDVRGMR